jgi:mRNA interferase RelE/StbE
MPPAYSIEVVPAAGRDLRRLPQQTVRRIGARIDALSLDPHPAGAEVIREKPGYYRIRIGEYRVVYHIDDTARTVLIMVISHRRDVYDRMNRRL